MRRERVSARLCCLLCAGQGGRCSPVRESGRTADRVGAGEAASALGEEVADHVGDLEAKERREGEGQLPAQRVARCTTTRMHCRPGTHEGRRGESGRRERTTSRGEPALDLIQPPLAASLASCWGMLSRGALPPSCSRASLKSRAGASRRRLGLLVLRRLPARGSRLATRCPDLHETRRRPLYIALSTRAQPDAADRCHGRLLHPLRALRSPPARPRRPARPRSCALGRLDCSYRTLRARRCCSRSTSALWAHKSASPASSRRPPRRLLSLDPQPSPTALCTTRRGRSLLHRRRWLAAGHRSLARSLGVRARSHAGEVTARSIAQTRGHTQQRRRRRREGD